MIKFWGSKTSLFKKSVILAFFLTFTAGIAAGAFPATSYAAATSADKQARVSITFDDGLSSTYANAEPILASNGLTATDYVISGCVGTTGTCPANPDTKYMTWAQIQALQNSDGWEIGSHTVDHPCLVDSMIDDPADCPNPSPLTTAQVDTELSNSKAALAAHGINATDFAPPYGDFNNNVIAQIAKYYASMRQFKNASDYRNDWPYSDYFLQNYVVQEKTTPVSSVETEINKAISAKQWVILTFHDVMPKPSKNPDDFQYGTTELSQIAAYIKSKVVAGQLQNTNVDNGLVTSNTNLIPNSNFAAGITDGWSTDSPSTIVADSGNNGSYPNPQHSVKITSGSGTGHLFSPKFAVNPYSTYMVKSFLNLTNITSGEVGYYIDEYNAQGQWISGQWKKQEANSFVEDMNYTYTPSSAAVASASLQFIVAGSGINGYIANPQVFPLTTTTPTNLMPNYNFAAGITGGWSTDSPSNIYADSNGNGAPDNPTYSASFNSPSTSSNIHLFAPQIAVTPGISYNVTSWVDIKTITTGAIGFYVDEYNSSGQWISGKYMFTDTTVGANNVGFTYTPSSTNVAKASIQYIVTGGNNVNAYLDDVVFSAK